MAGIADVVGIAAAVAKAVPGTAGAAAAAAQAAAEAAADHCDDVLESIPEDYSTLSSDVSDLKSAINDELQPLCYVDGLYITTSADKWKPDANEHYVYVPINANGTIYLKAKLTSSVFYCLFKSATAVVDTTPDYATGYSGGFSKIVAGVDITIAVPNDAKYIAYRVGNEPLVFTIDGLDYYSLYQDESLRVRLTELENKKIGEIGSLDELNSAIARNDDVIVLKNGALIEVSTAIQLNPNTVVIGNGATIKRADDYDGLLIRLDDNSSISGVTIDGNRLNTSSPTWDTTSEIRVVGDNCSIDGVTITDGNEAIVVYGDDCNVRNCTITNCGGNGIHFSGAQRTRVENCTIIGANKKTGMGHEDGCIIWSNACEHQVCLNNWCEDGISGFGSIDSVDNANIKIIGNTVKQCTYVVEAMYTSLQPSNLEITNNQFINSGSLVIRRVASGTDDGTTPAMVNVLIANNICIGTTIDCRYLKRLNIENNIVDLGSIIATKCPGCIVKGNTIEANENIGISLDTSLNAVVSGNSVIANVNAIYAGGSNGATITGNSLRVRILGTNTYPGSPCIATNGTTGIIIHGNTILSLYGLYLYAETICTDNIVKCRVSGETSIGQSTSLTGIVKNNIYYGNFRPEAGDNKFVSDNMEGSAPTTYSVACTLTNIEPVSVDAVWAQDSLLVQLVPSEGYALPDTITVSVGGVTLPLITQGDYVNVPSGYTYDKTTGIVRIPSVQNYVNITATGVSA